MIKNNARAAFNINSKLIPSRTVLAPMAGFSSSAYRSLCKRFRVGLLVTELISCDGLIRANENTTRLARFQESECPISIQLFGNNPVSAAHAARIISKLKPNFIDFNFGCPAPKVVKKDSGAALLRHPSLIRRIIRSIKDAVDIPITAKIRSGWDADSINAVEVAQFLQEAGASAVAIHARTKSQRFSGKADWELIARVVKSIDIPVIGNGDICSAQDALRMFESTECAAVMVGRGAIGRPWLFREIDEIIRYGEVSTAPPSFEEIIDICLQHLSLEIEVKGEIKAIREMRKFYGGYTKGGRNSAKLRKLLNQAQTFQEVKRILTGGIS
ncbi:MAG: tRNA dihydrouridine synthase DusB [Candidatus Cloacimonetes bacterium 4572_55]|nr:MAG: tRNA dihydrouridine synthase DusB [Candidatus Cloacimonetes bacterium 4572_55]